MRCRFSCTVVSTLAGSGADIGAIDGQGTAAGFQGPTGIALFNDVLLVAEYHFSHVIRRVTGTGGTSPHICVVVLVQFCDTDVCLHVS